MFENAELGQRVDNEEFKEREVELRSRLLTLQYKALDLGQFPIIIDFAGVDGAGKGTTVNMLNKWMDPRFIRTIGYLAPATKTRALPRFYRYWRDLPAHGRMGLYLSGRYSRPLLKKVYGHLDDVGFDQRLAEIIRFENTLSDDGALILKFWMHLGDKEQKARLKELSEDPQQAFKVDENDWRNHERYADFIKAAEKIITRTNRSHAPWTIVEGTDPNYRHLRAGEVIADELERRLNNHISEPASSNHRRENGKTNGPTVFSRLDLSKSVSKQSYHKKLEKRQARLAVLGRRAFEKGQSTVLVFEGPDASGKGGAIRRVVWSLDARAYRVHQFAAPTDIERAHHYLWRFWQALPRAGHVAVFDRSWYGRVLVERAEGFATETEWRRAYNEINDFEQQIVDRGILLLKFWLHIDKDEQLKRFSARGGSPYKHWKLTDEDWRNRELWDTYEMLGQDVMQYTSTSEAPWILVEGNDKHHARLTVLKTVNDQLEARLGG